MRPSPGLHVLAASFLALGLLATAGAAPPEADVPGQVDRLLGEEVFSHLPPDVTLAPRTSDELLLRRAFLDLVGRLPNPSEITTFVLDPSKDKRTLLIDRLLANADFGTNWARYWRNVIVYRRSTDQLLALMSDPLETFLREQFNANVAWDKIVRQFVAAKGGIQEHRQTALYMAEVCPEPVDVAAETSRIFLGIQIQCAQCHDHPFDRWKREQFHELVAFFPAWA